jgi:prepilin-type N-terminal cleavage/methylation domain-containing protein
MVDMAKNNVNSRQGYRPQYKRCPPPLNTGFTLVELTVVVVIAAMMLSLGLGALNAQLLSINYSETKKRQTVIKDALTAYLGANKRLPCPDIPNSTNGGTDGSQVTGQEDRAGGVPSGACSGTIGVVPYATLGLSRELALDGWGNFISYSLPTGGTCPGTGIDWSLTSCFGAGKGSPYSLFEGSVAAPTLSASNIIAIIISHGPNGLAAWGQQGSRNALPVSCEEAHNALTTASGCTLTANAFYKGERPEVDDVVSGLTKDEAINSLAKLGTIKTADGQITEDLPRLRETWMYSLLTNCSASAPAMPLDPWGNAYQAQTVWPRSICSSRGGGAATQTCASITQSEINLLIIKMGGATLC